MGNAVLHTAERHGSDEEDDEDKVGEESGHLGDVLVVNNCQSSVNISTYIHNLGTLSYSLDHGEIHQNPAENQTKCCKRMLKLKSD